MEAEELNKSILTAERTVKDTEAEFGARDERLAQALESYARLLRSGNRLMDAVDAEWKARAIRTALAKAQAKDGWIDPALGPSSVGTAGDTAPGPAPEVPSPTMPADQTPAQAATQQSPAATPQTTNAALPDEPSPRSESVEGQQDPPPESAQPPASPARIVGGSGPAPAAEPRSEPAQKQTTTTASERNLNKRLIAERIADGPQIGTPVAGAAGTTPAPQLSMRVCPHCQAAVTDYDSLCNYCHNSLAQVPTQYAGFWLRCAAFLIDYLILYIVESVVGFACFFFAMIVAMGASGGKELSDAGTILMLVLMIVVPLLAAVVIEWLYEAFCTASSWQATPGKLCVGIKVTDMEGRRLTFWRATARHFGKIISGLTLGMGYFMAGWTENKQALHDYMCATLVVKKAPKPLPPR